jgi:hypothetical protein
MPDMSERWLALEMGREHLGIHAIGLWGSAILILILFLFGAAIEVRRPLVLVWSTVLLRHVSKVLLCSKESLLAHTYVYRVIKSRMSHDEYSYSFLLLPKMKTATSTEQSTESS